MSNLFSNSILSRDVSDTKPYFVSVFRGKLIDPILVNCHKNGVVSQKPTFCVDDKRDAKFTCDAKSSNNDNQEIGVTRHPTASLNPRITKVDGSFTIPLT